MTKDIVTQKVKVLDVLPYKHGVYTSIGEGEPFVNDIVGREWSEDGEKVIFMLETHNFIFAKPEDEMDVIVLSQRQTSSLINGDFDFLSKRPKPSKTCCACGGAGKIELERNP